MIKKYSIILGLIVLFSCNESKTTIHKKNAFVIEYPTDISYDSIMLQSRNNRSKPIYTDKEFAIYTIDWGEWGGYIAFRDTSSMKTFLFPQSTIYEIGKFKSEYISFSHSQQANYSCMTLFSDPRKLFQLNDTIKVYTPELRKKIRYFDQKILHLREDVFQYSDTNETSTALIGVFIYKESIYLIQSNKISPVSIPATFLSKWDNENKTYEIIDTILNKTSFRNDAIAYTDINALPQIINFTYYDVNDHKKGLFIIKDSIIQLIYKR